MGLLTAEREAYYSPLSSPLREGTARVVHGPFVERGSWGVGRGARSVGREAWSVGCGVWSGSAQTGLRKN
ncbi:MAG TPA: hypothetical protein VJ728_01220, partial [Candidatus Binataceae bacterium]|nr:hypothetical protein [Candidatus Binataceae bacterium]